MYLPPLIFGLFMMTLGYGLFINFTAHSSWTKLIIFQIIAGLGIGPVFQSPIIALQAHIKPRDIGTATATLGFVRQLATSTSVVIGEVVFQNQMKKKAGTLTKALGPKLARELGGGNAGANTRLIDTLPQPQKGIVRNAFANSLSTMWIMYTAFAAAGLITVFFIHRQKLTKQHEETKTGLAAEKENAAERDAEREAKRESKRLSRASRQTGTTAADSRPPSMPPMPSMPNSRPTSSRPVSKSVNHQHLEPVQSVDETQPRDLEQARAVEAEKLEFEG